MSCDGCGCCAKCGHGATCTCNNSLFSLENEPAEFSFTMVGQTNDVAYEGGVAPGVNGAGGECVNCGRRAPGKGRT